MKRLALAVTILGALAAPAFARAATPPPIARPDPVTYPVQLNYTKPLSTLAPLAHESIAAATSDIAYLNYEKEDDLGGFVPAPVGGNPLTTGGHNVLPPGAHKTQIPLFSQAAGGKVSSFTFTGSPSGPTPPPDNGNGNGVQPPVPPTPGNVVPPANQGFGGNGNGGGGGTGTTTTTPPTTTTTGGGGSGGGTTTTTRRPPPTTTTTGSTTTTTTTTTATTTGATTTTATTTTTGGGGGGGSGGGGGGGGGGGCSGGSCAAGSCGVAGIQVDSSAPSCTISLSGAAPGASTQETMTITNTTGAPYQLSFKATGPHSNHLWQDLEMDVYDPSSPPTLPLPSLQSWVGAYHVLTSLNPGQTVQYVIELYLPTTAGNADMGESAVIDFHWHAQA